MRQKPVTPDLNALHEMLVTGDVASLEHVPSRLNPADGTTKPDHTLRIPILRLLSGVDVLWKHDPMVTGLFRPKLTKAYMLTTRCDHTTMLECALVLSRTLCLVHWVMLVPKGYMVTWLHGYLVTGAPW